MSSYFDEAESQYNAGDIPRKKELNEKVIDRVGQYLKWIREHCKKAELPKLQPLERQYERIVQLHRTDWMLIQELHTLAHTIGNARIAIRGRGWASDNPYFPGNYDYSFD